MTVSGAQPVLLILHAAHSRVLRIYVDQTVMLQSLPLCSRLKTVSIDQPVDGDSDLTLINSLKDNSQEYAYHSEMDDHRKAF